MDILAEVESRGLELNRLGDDVTYALFMVQRIAGQEVHLAVSSNMEEPTMVEILEEIVKDIRNKSIQKRTVKEQ